MPENKTALGTTLTAMRGVVMIAAGLFAIAYPAEAVRFVVFVGGGILLLDGILNLASLNLRGQRDLEFWAGLLRSASAIGAGLLIIFSPWLSAILPVTALRWIIGVQAIVVGLAEIVSLLIYGKGAAARKSADRPVWAILVSGGAYALFGLALIVMPLEAATVVARIVAVLMIVFAVSLFIRTWRQRAAGGRY